VEGEGYKNIINQPDWLNKPKKIKKSRMPQYLTCFYCDIFRQVLSIHSTIDREFPDRAGRILTDIAGKTGILTWTG
jgi:hypothetical protein